MTIFDPIVVLGKGINTFTTVIKNLEKFKALLEKEGVNIREVHRLDGLDPVPSDSFLLPDDAPTKTFPM